MYIFILCAGQGSLLQQLVEDKFILYLGQPYDGRHLPVLVCGKEQGLGNVVPFLLKTFPAPPVVAGWGKFFIGGMGVVIGVEIVLHIPEHHKQKEYLFHGRNFYAI